MPSASFTLLLLEVFLYFNCTDIIRTETWKNSVSYWCFHDVCVCLHTECVQQATFPCIGGSCDDHLHTTAQSLPPPLILQVFLHLCLQLMHRFIHCVCVFLEVGTWTEERQDVMKVRRSRSFLTSWKGFCDLKKKSHPTSGWKMGHRLDSLPCVTTAETSNTTYQQYVIFCLNKTETLKDLKTIIHQAERSWVKA